MQVNIYTNPVCTWCGKLKEWLKKWKVAYQEFNLEDDDKYYDEILQKSGQLAVPVIEIDGKVIVGFQEELLEKALFGKDRN
ncbi:glutaredoxin family protein [Candidatus Woesearchaeota archaeon]|nr:glutaredoxin family protein [Candidatus Woesearchaeota archaeon]